MYPVLEREDDSPVKTEVQLMICLYLEMRLIMPG